MESSGAKKYTVADDRKQRSSVLLDKVTEGKLSWIKAMEKANTTLQQERQDANENNSKINILDIQNLQNVKCKSHWHHHVVISFYKHHSTYYLLYVVFVHFIFLISVYYFHLAWA